ncbi:dihydroneopterin aldolase [Gilvimarinus sp. SDUM040013]|uniref:7,8-dihydroneopterin aldolase n=1 Tax=Gilvimarinus gilvus TaxID=3058038 RepID=A0ABU4RWM7_9GAMM|nr:dihydroneopterin aldolase [Gilvimarinus sp. SDUM040013]MDO3385301.1 dihydroneopterin aldolase [Gilvimarinus sp. SDUM040013]MDX6849284.1 dihydroneopterin aldolase [Gilvimarinus sp. SDUM040013]
MDIVYIRDLQIQTIIGIYDWERQVRQTVSIDLEMAADIRRAAQTDDIQYALNYKAVSKRVIAHVEGREALLVESLAEEVAALVRDEFNVPWLRLRVSKPGALRGARDVGLVIERGEKPV